MSAFRSPPELLMRHAVRALRPQVTSRKSSTYRIAMVTEEGKPLEIQTVDRATEVPDEFARVSVHHASINFADILLSQGKYQVKPPVPFGLGSEFAGEILEVGRTSGPTALRPGMKVAGMSTMMNAFAEELLVPVAMLNQMPDNASTADASALLCVYGTAWMALKRHGRIQEGDYVLVTAAAGGVGLAAVDLATNLFNAKVIAACGSDEKCALAMSRGAFATVNYNKEVLHQKVKEVTGGHGADIIFENVGGDTFKSCLRSVAFEGRILVIGFASGEIPKIPANILLVKSCSAVGVWWGNYSDRHPVAFRESVEAVLDAYHKGIIKPHISKVVPLAKVNDAFQFILARKSTGKVVIDCQS